MSSLTIISLGKDGIRPSKVVKQSDRAEALQLWIGSGLFAFELSMQHWMTLLSNGRICLTMKFAPIRQPER